MIARLVGNHLASVPPVTIVLLFILGAPAVLLPAPVIVLTLVIVWRIVPPRPTAFEAALPVRGREVVIARVIATLALMALPMSASFILPLLNQTLSFMLTKRLSSLLAIYALGVVAALLPYLVYRGSLGSPPRMRYAFAWGALAWAVLVAIGPPALFPLSPLAAAWLLALGAVALVAALWLSIPDALRIAPGLSPRGARPLVILSEVKDLHRHAATEPGRRVTSGTGARSALAALHAILPWRVVVFYPLLIVMTMFDRAMGLFWIAVLATYSIGRAHTRWLTALPVSHRARLLAIVVPAVVLPACCVAIGRILSEGLVPQVEPLRPRPSRMRQLLKPETRSDVRADYWHRAPAGTAPVITAPWGERVVADTATVFGIHLYNPWTSSLASSPRFEDWQFERVTAEVYGRPLTLAQFDAGERPARRLGDARTWIVYAATLLTLGLLLMWIAELGRSHRWPRVRAAPMIALCAAALPLFALYYLDASHHVRGRTVVVAFLHRALRELAAALPDNIVLATLLAAVPVAGAWALLEWRFARSELPSS